MQNIAQSRSEEKKKGEKKNLIANPNAHNPIYRHLEYVKREKWGEEERNRRAQGLLDERGALVFYVTV